MKHVSFEISNKWEDQRDLQVNIPWVTARPNSSMILFKSRINNKDWLIRMNDFPDYPLFTLLIEDDTPHDELTYFDEIIHFDDWPEFWGKKPELPELLPKHK
jgi:hypothetical protein